jgi:hypothetical protein
MTVTCRGFDPEACNGYPPHGRDRADADDGRPPKMQTMGLMGIVGTRNRNSLTNNNWQNRPPRFMNLPNMSTRAGPMFGVPMAQKGHCKTLDIDYL